MNSPNTNAFSSLATLSQQLKKQNNNNKKDKNNKNRNDKPKSPIRGNHMTVEELIKKEEGKGIQITTDTYPEMERDLLLSPSTDIGPQHFVMIKLLGRGASAKVLLVRCILNGKVYAMKVIEKKSMDATKALRYALHERRVLSRLHYPFLIDLFCSFQTTDYLYLVMEYCQGGELFKHIIEEGFFSEKEAMFYIAEVILAIDHLHSCGIIHRDIKPENILLSREGHIVICDFGVCFDREDNPHKASLSENCEDDMQDNTLCGTYDYMAPEVLHEGTFYGKAVDWWSVGCLLYEMTSGSPPFVAKTKDKLFEMIMKSKLKLPPYQSTVLHSLLKGLIERDATKRLGAQPSTITQIGGVAKLKQHPFFKGLNWYALERKEVTPPIAIITESDVDTRYFDDSYTNFPIDKLNKYTMRDHQNSFRDFTFVSEELKANEQYIQMKATTVQKDANRINKEEVC